MAQNSSAKPRPLSESARLTWRAEEALDKWDYATALELIIQANADHPSLQNDLLKARALNGLGRVAESYSIFERSLTLDNVAESRYDLSAIVAFAEAARSTNHLDKSRLLYKLALRVVSKQQILGTPDGRVIAIDPGSSQDTRWLDAAKLTIEVFLPPAPTSGQTEDPESVEDRVVRLRTIDRLAPSWNRVWPLLLLNISTANPEMRNFINKKVSQLINSSDPELSKSMSAIRKWILGADASS